jgi:hypothetical protein
VGTKDPGDVFDRVQRAAPTTGSLTTNLLWVPLGLCLARTKYLKGAGVHKRTAQSFLGASTRKEFVEVGCRHT